MRLSENNILNHMITFWLVHLIDQLILDYIEEPDLANGLALCDQDKVGERVRAHVHFHYPQAPIGSCIFIVLTTDYLHFNRS